MGFLEILSAAAEVAGAMGMLYMYKQKYAEYDEEELFDEYVRLSKIVRFGYYAEDEDKAKLEAAKMIMKEKEWF